MSGKYESSYQESIANPEKFWGAAAEDVQWYKKFTKVLDDTNKPFYRWFTGGEMNTCYNCVDYHVENGRGDQVAVIYDSPITGTIKRYTYKELLDRVARFAGVLSKHGAQKGDRVIIYMPMIPEALFAMLACARLGVIHSVVFGGFAPNELAVRIDDAKPKLMISASCGLEGKKVIEYKPLLDKAISLAKHKPAKSIIYQREQVAAPLTPAMILTGSKNWPKQLITNVYPF
jgi:propionyl-CoA synthetase